MIMATFYLMNLQQLQRRQRQLFSGKDNGKKELY
nr:MAG TPA: hypothetical protein [Bacteriophage sp.]